MKRDDNETADQFAKRVQVAVSAIQRDLAVTSNIDETITRILDGTVSYVPEQLSDDNENHTHSISNQSGLSDQLNNTKCREESDQLSLPPLLNTAAKTFGK